jgi:hypothetical protein
MEEKMKKRKKPRNSGKYNEEKFHKYYMDNLNCIIYNLMGAM